ncbi:MAG: DUF5411 family protein [Bacilli bacterium]
MKESFWSIFIVTVGVVAITFIFLFQTLTNTDEHNMHLLKESTKGAMYDALDLASYRRSGEIRIDREKFVENFLRRFSENAALSRTYQVQIFDVNELPPKVSIRIKTSETGKLFALTGEDQVVNFTISDQLDAILETPY